jgi:hypothetical protein
MMNDPRQSGQADDFHGAGLCATCANAQVVTSNRGSRFLLCRVSTIDPRYPRYPQLPVVQCGAYHMSAD